MAAENDSIASLKTLHTESLSIGYRNKEGVTQLFSKLNLSLNKGELVCLLGPNGVGKSTLIRTLAGIQPPLSGSTFIDDVNVSKISKKELSKKISLVLTDRVHTGNLSVYNLLTMGRYPYLNWFGLLSDNDETIIKNAIQAAGIEQFLEKNVYDLSDGERQKVMIARAIIQDTALIILDEPTAHLDLPSRVEIMRLLRRMVKKTGITVVLSTHELDLALQAADTIWLMMPGESLITGIAEDLILDGTFEQAFRKNGVDFCRETGNFKMNFPHENKTISLSGEGASLFWTRRALEREGYRISGDAKTSITITESTETVWQLHANREEYHFANIQLLLMHLRQHW